MKKNVLVLGLMLGMYMGVMAQGGGNTFRINGQLKNLQATHVYLIYINDNKQILDSATVTNGAYVLTGEVAEGGPATLLDVSPMGGRPAPRDIARIFLGPESFSVTHVDSFSNAVVTGSTANTDYQEITAAEKPYEKREMAMMPAYQAARQAKDEATTKSIEAQAKVIDKAVEDSVYAPFVHNHPQSPLAIYVLQSYAKNDPDAPALRSLFDGLSPAVKGSTGGKAFAEKLAIATKTSVGATAMNFTQNDTAGKPVTLSAFRGKYVLVDFWASWCGPCRAENPNVLKSYRAYHSKGFTVLGVSLDDEKSPWLEAIKKDGLPWTEVSDLKGWKNSAAVLYGIEGIPMNFLLDKNGVIVAKGLRGDDLEKKLAEFLH